jgi:predicted metalloprotease
VIAALVALGALSSCGTPDPVLVERSREVIAAPVDTTETGPLPDDTDDTDEPTEPEPDTSDPGPISVPDNDGLVDFGDGKPPQQYDDTLLAAVADIESWWSEQLPAVYDQSFEPLAGGIYAAFADRTDELPGCGERSTSYREVSEYVAFYCADDDFILYDDGEDTLLDSLTEELESNLVIGVVLAHEYGHAIQRRTGALDRNLATVYTEQQADCFAGAWMGRLNRGESPLLTASDRDVRSGILAMISVRDPAGVSQLDAGGHGSAFDRVGAFQVGFVEGPARCAEVLDDPLPLVPNEYRSLADQQNQGNAPYTCRGSSDPNCVDVFALLGDDLDRYWQEQLAARGTAFDPLAIVAAADPSDPGCGDLVGTVVGGAAYCPSQRTLYYDEPAMRSLYDEFGDFTIGYLFGAAFGEAVQLELASPLTGEARALANDCLAGAWVYDIAPDERGETPSSADAAISPGDLDEAIQTAILVGDSDFDDDVVGSSFEKIDAFRTGVLQGLDPCLDRLGG